MDILTKCCAVYQKLRYKYYQILTGLKLLILNRDHGRKNLFIKPILFSYRSVKLGSYVFIRDHGRIEAVVSYKEEKFSPLIVFEDKISIEQNVHITCANSVYISKNTAIAANVSITDIDHPYADVTIAPEYQDIVVGKVFIGEDCKIYNNVVILPNVHLGKHTVVGANSVVLGNKYPDFCVLVGAPAKIVKRYCFKKEAWLSTDKDGCFLNNN
ncbi:hypothetical protein ASU31_01780 [Pedobacter ginsenosidimutans]|uniref:Acetyltransferase n=1 Tax=Pedobacter ginsenosidimutans TaxID=687842 RepID=A0A0T5VWL1_9SPHI|nr:acyltransferase [Pedobacter ginsenosidimutans]KRT18041.1 hypothetical protein ASU31_01780 [Pedobacter ginsenosidimutans]